MRTMRNMSRIRRRTTGASSTRCMGQLDNLALDVVEELEQDVVVLDDRDLGLVGREAMTSLEPAAERRRARRERGESESDESERH